MTDAATSVVATAVHEAGHAVLGVWLGVPVVSVDVIPTNDDGPVGHTVCARFPAYVADWHEAGDHRPAPEDVRQRLEHQLMVHLAGDLAEYKAAGTRHGRPGVDESVVVGWGWHIGDLLDAVTAEGMDRGECLARLTRLTGALLDRGAVWATVDAVAAALVERRHLTGRQLRAIACEVVARGWLEGPALDTPDGPPGT